jgi:hypothetical protein
LSSLARCLLAQHAAFASITGTATPNGDGTYTYSYAVDNSGGSFDIAAWSLEFDFAVPDWNQLDFPTGAMVSIPNLAGAPPRHLRPPAFSAQDFFTLANTDDAKINTTLSGFSFASRFQPGNILFSEFSEGADFSNAGTVVGPSSGITTTVPDGGAGIGLITFGALATFGAVNRTRR